VVAPDDFDELAARPGWFVEPDPERPLARYASTSGWSATIRIARRPNRIYDSLHLAVVDPRNRAVYAIFLAGLSEAVRLAEAHVAARSVGSSGKITPHQRLG
jgi:hypothetical protein